MPPPRGCDASRRECRSPVYRQEMALAGAPASLGGLESVDTVRNCCRAALSDERTTASSRYEGAGGWAAGNIDSSGESLLEGKLDVTVRPECC